MNRVCLIGRLTSKPELRYTSSNIAITRLTVAINRNYKNEQGNYDADFINCIAWKNTAELITKYFNKGSQIGIEGRIQTGSYDDKDNKRVYTTDVIVENVTFLDKKEVTQQETQKEEINTDPFADFGEQVEIDQYSDDSFLD